MAKKPKKQQDDQHRDGENVEIPEDRLEQIGQAEPQNKPEKKIQQADTSHRKQEQDQSMDDAVKPAKEESESSKEDLLADIRRSLADEEDVEEPKGLFGRIRQRLSGRSESKSQEVEPQSQLETEADTQEDTQADLQDVVEKLAEKQKPLSKKKSTLRDKEEEKAIQEFFADLEALAEVEDVQTITEIQETKSEEPQADEKVKVPKLPAKSKVEDEIDFDTVREVALEEYDETKIEPVERKPPLREEVQQTIRELRPFERMLVIALGILTVGVLLSSGVFLIVNSISIPTPTPTVEVDPGKIVHPTQMTLPGGWEFNLGQGRVQEGKWTPKGAEWLVGTEISRWVALPWSLQLEAVLRTLKADDQIELSMSNFKVLTFNVYSIQEMSMESLLATDPTKPGLLVVLYNDEEADGTFWVVTALPARDE